MSETYHEFLTSSQMRSLRAEQLVQRERLGEVIGRLASLESLLHSFLRHPTSTGAQPSSASPTSIPGTPGSTLKSRMSDLSEWARLASLIVGICKFMGLAIPAIMLGAAAVWRWLLPYLSRLWDLFWHALPTLAV